MTDFRRLLDRTLERVRRKMALQIGRLLLEAVDDSGTDAVGRGTPQRVAGVIFAGEGTLEDLAHLQPYGLSAHPIPGAEGVALQVGGSRSRMVVVSMDDPRHRPTGLQEGEVALYTDERLAILLKRSDEIELRAATIDSKADGTHIVQGGTVVIVAQSGGSIVLSNSSGAITATGASVTMTASGAVSITGGTVSIGSSSTIDGKNFLGHTHSGVTPGTGNSGPVV